MMVESVTSHVLLAGRLPAYRKRPIYLDVKILLGMNTVLNADVDGAGSRQGG
ncbi:hypothetical protein D3C72_2260980 [compost metagenome]